MTKKTYKLDIFNTLGQINQKNTEFFQGLTEDEKKGFQPMVTMRWMSGTSSPLQVVLLNELVNPYVFSLPNHKDLLFKLMTLCSSGKQRNKWITRKDTDRVNCKHSIEVIKNHYGYSTQSAYDVLPLLNADTIISMAEDQGIQKDILTKLKAELKTK